MNRWLRIVRAGRAADPRRPAGSRCRRHGAARRSPSPPRGRRRAAVPPIIDRELFFGDPEIAGAQLSPDGQYLVVHQAVQRHPQHLGEEDRRAVRQRAGRSRNDQKRPIAASSGAATASTSCSSQDKDGDENFNVYAVDPAAAPPPAQDVPAARNLTDAKGVRALIYAVPKDRPRHDLRRPQRSRHGLARPLQGDDLDGRSASSLRKNTDKIAGWVFDEAGQLRLAARTTTTATPRSCASTTTRSSRSTRAASSRPAGRSASTRTARAST